jgi:hypothetical protein
LNCRYVERKMQVDDHMHVILLACKERDALPVASRRPISTIQGRIIFWKGGLMFVMISASVYSGILEIARAMENCVRVWRSCGKSQERG